MLRSRFTGVSFPNTGARGGTYGVQLSIIISPAMKKNICFGIKNDAPSDYAWGYPEHSYLYSTFAKIHNSN